MAGGPINFSEVVEPAEYLKSFKMFFYEFIRLLECLEVQNNFSEVVEPAECLKSFKIFYYEFIRLPEWLEVPIIFQKL